MAISQNNKLFYMYVKTICPDAVEEYKFCPERKFRADVYVPSLNLLIEYEGISAAKSRHTTALGYTRDCEKYNLAGIMGFRVLRYTALNRNDLRRDIESLKKGFDPEKYKTKKQVLKEFFKKVQKKA